MSLDTKYRPLRYADVLGQEATIQVCREYVRSLHGFRQSYVFAGFHGGGKTTVARILARALLCSEPVEGEPCDKCGSCLAMLDGRSEGFIEIDAATNSGKDNVRKIVEDAQFGTYSGHRRLYLVDESHELSRQAQDALLKPLEDNIRGTQDKQLVCIFCTTEVEKMRPAILSRCAPSFRIRPNTPDQIAERLAHICTQEGLDFEPEALPVIAEVVECHVRDAIKAVEGVSMLGAVNRTNVRSYLSLDANERFLDILEHLGSDPAKVLEAAVAATEITAPGVCYEKMAEVCVLAYRLVHVGSAPVPSYWDRSRLQKIGEGHREFLILFAQRFAERPARPSASMFVCDVSALHQTRGGVVVAQVAPLQAQVVSQLPLKPNPVGSVSTPSFPLPTPVQLPIQDLVMSEPTPLDQELENRSKSGSIQTAVTPGTLVSVNPALQHRKTQNLGTPVTQESAPVLPKSKGEQLLEAISVLERARSLEVPTIESSEVSEADGGST